MVDTSLAQGLSINKQGSPLYNGLPIQSTNSSTGGLTGNTPQTTNFDPVSASATMQKLGISAPAPVTPSPFKVTPQGGVNFGGAQTTPTPQPNTAYGSDASRTYQTPAGASIQLNPDGSIKNTTSAQGFKIDTSGSIPSSALQSNVGANDVSQAHSQYMDYVNGLAQAQGYSPDYIAALQAQQRAQAQGAAINSNYYTGNNLPGDTQTYAQGATAKAQAQNSLENLTATQALNTQALIRTGNIAGAQSLVEATKPVSVSPGSALVSPSTGQEAYSGLGGYQAVQGIQTVNNLAQNFPDAGIQPGDSLQVATQKAAQAPSFSSRNLTQISLPGGGTSFVNKNQLITNPTTGQVAIITPQQGTQAAGYSKAVQDLTAQSANIGSSIAVADNNFPLLLQKMKEAGINDFSSPLANQIQQNVTAKVNGSLASFNAVLSSLDATYTQILSRGYQPTDTIRKEASALVNGTLNYNDLSNLYKTLKTESQNVLKGIDQEKQVNISGLNSVYSSAQPLSGGQSQSQSQGQTGYIDPSQATW